MQVCIPFSSVTPYKWLCTIVLFLAKAWAADALSPSDFSAVAVTASFPEIKHAESDCPPTLTGVPEYTSIKSRMETLITSSELPMDAMENWSAWESALAFVAPAWREQCHTESAQQLLTAKTVMSKNDLNFIGFS